MFSREINGCGVMLLCKCKTKAMLIENKLAPNTYFLGKYFVLTDFLSPHQNQLELFVF